MFDRQFFSAPSVEVAPLLRGAEVVDGIELARDRRQTSKTDADLARPPASSQRSALRSTTGEQSVSDYRAHVPKKRVAR